jgi:predicted outer membrane protein
MMTHGRDQMKDLVNQTKGKDWDKSYIDKMVDDHQAMLGKLQDAAKDNTDPELAKMLVDATAKTQAMLTKAQEIQAKLNK